MDVNTARITYTLGGTVFWVASDLTWLQEKWLWPVTKKVLAAGEDLTVDYFLDLINDHGAQIAAILLIPEGSTQAQKVEHGWDEVLKLEAWIGQTATSFELMGVLSDFFVSGQLMRLVRGRMALRVDRSVMTGLTAPSPSSPAATSPKPNGSGHGPASENPITISSSAPNTSG